MIVAKEFRSVFFALFFRVKHDQGHWKLLLLFVQVSSSTPRHNDKSKTIFDVGPTLVPTFEDPDGNFIQISQPKNAD
jgi:hypothetical protein